MTSIDTWPLWMAIVFAGGPILLGCVGIALCVYLSRRHLDAIVDALKNSRYLYIWAQGWRRQGWIGECVLINRVAGIVVWPQYYIRCGDVDPLEIRRFPSHLKKLLTAYVVTVVVTIVWMFIVYLLVKFK
ncbi:MAG: hypothetical protein I8H81_05685 [Pseudomonadales bacterium]|nr:hypothetical protein [Pseudomonadales bacterium]MBH2033528.1 hypothetical protein [Pseudomonadales bacterium]MBH2075168.1 hypothetical protein [Pseudomonadales bacterium]